MWASRLLIHRFINRFTVRFTIKFMKNCVPLSMIIYLSGRLLRRMVHDLLMIFYFQIIFFSSLVNQNRYWIMPVGRSLGIKSTKTKPPVPNKTLEITYSKISKLNHKTVSLVFFCPFFFIHFLSTIFVDQVPMTLWINFKRTCHIFTVNGIFSVFFWTINSGTIKSNVIDTTYRFCLCDISYLCL